jgi:hypothetical protein
MATVVISAAALVISIISAVFAYRQLQHARTANALPIVIDLFAEFRQPKLAEARTFVWRSLPAQDPSRGFESIEDPVGRDGVAALANYLDNLGLLVDRGLVDVVLVAGFMGNAIIPLWDKMRPFIDAERARRSTDYMRYFEALVAEIHRASPSAVLARVTRLPSS